MVKCVVLDKNLNPVHLPPIFKFKQYKMPKGCNCHEEIYAHNGYEVGCLQWKTCEGDAFSYWMQIKGGNITLGDVTYLVMAYFQEIALGFTPTLDNLIDVVRYYRGK